ncbi:MAG: CDP-diacylglycerol--serine O-phosphatidyltransferase [Bacteroidales bacterium]|nr:CDP-diacylglycerol--serine O-phosphatidyltransferase [Bacteroidales bacterium]
MVKSIPNILTLLNLFSGCIAIVLVFNGAYTHASWLIVIAAVFDFLDGTAARLLNARSELGKQLDSLADMVSFGVAPASIMYALMVNTMGYAVGGYVNLNAVPAFFIALFSALRLAKFNIDASQTYSFRGLPTPANALFISALPFIHLHAISKGSFHAMLGSWFDSYYVLLGLTLLLSFLLVSNLPLMGLKLKSVSWKENHYKYIFLILSVIMGILVGFSAAPFILLLYIFLSVAEYYHMKFEAEEDE